MARKAKKKSGPLQKLRRGTYGLAGIFVVLALAVIMPDVMSQLVAIGIACLAIYILYRMVVRRRKP